jgi:PiT family inorganic phosphate transporter
MSLFGESIALSTGLFLLIALGMALLFECVNGFHDTANAVATVIYTHTLRPWIAVVWSGLWNLIGVLTSSGAVAFGVIALLPVELVLNVGSGSGFAMVFALLISAIIWNLGTWYLGLPASSSHTLIGSMMGVGLANSVMSPSHAFGEGVNWAKVYEVFSSLLISPVVGFVCSALLLLLSKALIRQPALYQPADAKQAPPLWIRSLLILTCTGVSFAHGSNDGQKGMGLIMLILVGILPGVYALNLGADSKVFSVVVGGAQKSEQVFQKKGCGRQTTGWASGGRRTLRLSENNRQV